MTNRSGTPSSQTRPGPRAASRHGVGAGHRGHRRRQTLIGTLLAVALGLLALALPSAAGALGSGTPAAWMAPTPPRHAPAGTGAHRSASTTSPAGLPAATTPPAPAPASTPPPAASSTATTGPEAVTHAPVAPPPPTPAPATLAGAAAPAATGAESGAEAEVLALVNQQRAAAGCAALTASTPLADLARAHSADMRDRGYFSHNTPEGLSPFDRADAAGITTMRAENIAMGQATPADVMASWMASPGHRANILDCSLRTLGVGVAYGTGGPWWTQDFGV